MQSRIGNERSASCGDGIVCFSGTQHASLAPLTNGSMTSRGGLLSEKTNDNFPQGSLPASAAGLDPGLQEMAGSSLGEVPLAGG